MRNYIILSALTLLLVGVLGGCTWVLDGLADSLADDLVIDRANYEIVHDLTDLNLIDHDLDDSALLEQISLYTFLRRAIGDVLLIRDGDTDAEPGHILNGNDTWSIGLYYFTRRHESAVDSALWSMEFDKADGFIAPDAVLTVGPVRVGAEEQTAVVAVLEENVFGDVFLHVYMAQNVPGSNEVVVLDIWLSLAFLEARDMQILAELSAHIGIDFASYITEFAGHLLPEEIV